jgi:hypothetical protein
MSDRRADEKEDLEQVGRSGTYKTLDEQEGRLTEAAAPSACSSARSSCS